MFSLKLINKKELNDSTKIAVAILLSILLHLFLLILLNNGDWLKIDLGSEDTKEYKEVEIIFPENKPKQIVQNINENEEIPELSDLLSDRNSKARNQSLLKDRSLQPFSEGYSPFLNLSKPGSRKSDSYEKTKKFSRDALIGQVSSRQNKERIKRKEISSNNNQISNVGEQKNFSADAVGNISLSTYAWEWAPYINKFRNKLLRVWYAPPAYYQLGLIHGYTVMQLVISKEGKLMERKVLKHEGHSSLQTSSVGAVDAVFPFVPLPVNFPDENLIITLTMVYPNPRERR